MTDTLQRFEEWLQKQLDRGTDNPTDQYHVALIDAMEKLQEFKKENESK